MGRIPNFKGAEVAGRRLLESEEFQGARFIKSNPDSPQRTVRFEALKANKTVYLAVPKLAQEKPFIELNPMRLETSDFWHASSIKGSTELGRPVSLSEMKKIDLIVTGCVAVSRNGARLGKGGGYADLEFALLREARLVGETTPVVTVVHSVQLLPNGSFEMSEHDTSVDLIATERQLIRCKRKFKRPSGIFDHALSPEKRMSIPVLRKRS
jgi:5-formyltetrahydrofolate cyclo-ligase